MPSFFLCKKEYRRVQMGSQTVCLGAFYPLLGNGFAERALAVYFPFRCPYRKAFGRPLHLRFYLDCLNFLSHFILHDRGGL